MRRSFARLVAALGTLVAVLGPTPARAQTHALETRLKAALVSKFPQFVEWPSVVTIDRPSVDVCVGSPDPFGVDLEELTAGETLNGRSIVVRRVEREQDLDGCYVLFLPAPPGGGRHPLLKKAASLPILSVGDSPRFLDEGGIVGLRVVQGRLRFDVNAAAARRVGLRISSQLLQLALTVRGAAS